MERRFYHRSSVRIWMNDEGKSVRSVDQSNVLSESAWKLLYGDTENHNKIEIVSALPNLASQSGNDRLMYL